MLIKRVAGGTALLLTLTAAGQDDRGWPAPPPAAPPGSGPPAAASKMPSSSLDPRAAYLAGKRACQSGERRRLFSAGVAAARVRLEGNAEDPAGLLWLAANLGSEALEHGKLNALRVLPEMERLLLRLEAAAPLYDHAAAARTLGRLYHKAPRIISIGSMKRARTSYERALSRAADFPPNLVLAADFFADDGDQGRAFALAQRYLAAPASAAEEPDAGEWMEIARRIVARGPQ